MASGPSPLCLCVVLRTHGTSRVHTPPLHARLATWLSPAAGGRVTPRVGFGCFTDSSGGCSRTRTLPRLVSLHAPHTHPHSGQQLGIPLLGGLPRRKTSVTCAVVAWGGPQAGTPLARQRNSRLSRPEGHISPCLQCTREGNTNGGQACAPHLVPVATSLSLTLCWSVTPVLRHACTVFAQSSLVGPVQIQGRGNPVGRFGHAGVALP